MTALNTLVNDLRQRFDPTALARYEAEQEAALTRARHDRSAGAFDAYEAALNAPHRTEPADRPCPYYLTGSVDDCKCHWVHDVERTGQSYVRAWNG